MSVSTLALSKGAVMPVNWVNACILYCSIGYYKLKVRTSTKCPAMAAAAAIAGLTK